MKLRLLLLVGLLPGGLGLGLAWALLRRYRQRLAAERAHITDLIASCGVQRARYVGHDEALQVASDARRERAAQVQHTAAQIRSGGERRLRMVNERER